MVSYWCKYFYSASNFNVFTCTSKQNQRMLKKSKQYIINVFIFYIKQVLIGKKILHYK